MTSTTVATSSRVVGYDGFRGLAVLLMLVDHLALVLGGPLELRMSIGRLAMPAFFLLAGHLARGPRWRHLWIAALGVLLGQLTFVESPNVLTWWAVGVLLLWAARVGECPEWLVAALGLVVAANGWTSTDGTYDPYALWGLMALGSMLPATAFTWAGFVPSWVAFVGRHPIAFYAGHVLVLQLLFVQAGAG